MPRTVLRIITRLNRGGPLRQLTALVPRLAAYGWDGPVVYGRTPSHEPDGATDLAAVGTDLRHLGSLRRGIDPSADARALRALMAIVRSVRPAVVHTHLGKAGALGRLAARACGVATVHTYHGHHLEGAWWKSALARHAEWVLGRFTTAAICLSPRQRRDLVRVHRVLPADRVHVIAPGMDLDAFRARAVRGRRRGGQDGRAHFVWTGRFVKVKDPERLVEAVALSSQPFRVTMLGRGPRLRAIRATIRAHGLGDRIACPGAVADVAPWVAGADGLVLCSLSEGAPLSVIEAMALARPVVVSTVGALPDMVEHAGTGLWVPPGDAPALARALDRLAADPALRTRLGRAGAAQVDARFGAERLARETAALYDVVAGAPAPAGGDAAARPGVWRAHG